MSSGCLLPHPEDAARQVADLPSLQVQAHAANLMVLADGTVGCVWFGGSMEGRADISVYMSRLEPGSLVVSGSGIVFTLVGVQQQQGVAILDPGDW